MTSQQILRALIAETIEQCEGYRNGDWQQLPQYREAIMMQDKSKYMTRVRLAIAEVALAHDVPAHEIRRFFPFNIEWLGASRLRRARAEMQYPELCGLEDRLSKHLERRIEEFYGTANVQPFVPGPLKLYGGGWSVGQDKKGHAAVIVVNANTSCL